MFTAKCPIWMGATDSTGAIYFAELFRLALESFEHDIQEKELGLKVLRHQGVAFPIVHAEADYLHPICLGDQLKVDAEMGDVGNSSFAIKYVFSREGIIVAHVKIVHVYTLHGKSSAIPPSFLASIKR